ncbi:MAG: alpha,alpha-trehalose-phosphate synthase (UDP-forming) [Gaiellales bacterium]
MARDRHRLTVVSNRGPIQYARSDGERVALRGSGGLVSALRGLIGANDVTWIVCAISDEDHVVAAEQDGRALEETDAVGNPFRLHFADPAPEDYAAMYGAIANPLLWFIQHGLYASGEEPVVSTDVRAAWAGYRRYNAAVAAEAAVERDCDALMIHDYQLYLVPAMLRESGVDRPILHFTHIPWPAPGAWQQLPIDLRTELLHGLLGADIVGFHTHHDVDHFLATCAQLETGVEVDWERAVVRVTIDRTPREVHVRAYPISIDPAEFRAYLRDPEMIKAHAEFLRTRPKRLILRVDRTDPSKNILRGFHAYGRLLDRRPDLHGEVQLLSLLDPSRLAVPVYANYLKRINAIAAEVNEAHGRDGWLPIDLRIGDNFPTVVAAYREYDALLVNSIADGMNLISKEAPLLNERDGVVVLSDEAGSHEELEQWVLTVDPLDVEQTAAQLERALDLPQPERGERAAAIRAFVEEHDVARWIDLQLADLEQLAAASA